MHEPLYQCEVCEIPMRSEGFCQLCVDSFAAFCASGDSLASAFYAMSESQAVALMQEYAA